MTLRKKTEIDWSSTAHWYDDHADSFEMSTLAMRSPDFLDDFISLLPKGARILDAGCGAGRDTRALLDKGFEAHGFDASEKMIEATNANTSGRAALRHMSFADFGDSPNSWQGIWALASLLHLPRGDVPRTLSRLLSSLTPEGVLCFSVKQGEGEEIDQQGRPMTYFGFDEICDMVFSVMPGGGHIEAEIQSAQDSSGNSIPWINVTVVRTLAT